MWGLGVGFIYTLAKDGAAFLRGRRRRLSNAQKIEARQKWKPQFEAEIFKNFREKLREDVIVRDVKRVDNYPDIQSAKKGISPWFRVALVGTYHRGVLLGLGWYDLKQEREVYRRVKSDEEGAVSALLVGRVPYENIESVDWNGDEFYYFPHIYCHFEFRKEPYEELVYCLKIESPNVPPHYSEIAPYAGPG